MTNIRYMFRHAGIGATLLLLGACATNTKDITAAPMEGVTPDERAAYAVDLRNAATLLPSTDLSPSGILEELAAEFSWDDYSSQPLVKYWIDQYLADREAFLIILSRAEPFKFHVADAVRERNLPAELAFLPMVESGYRSDVRSWSGAAGLWQFMPITGRAFSLQQDWWIDERNNLIASTRAALDYLEYLHRLFDGDWLIALGAYNTGEGNMRAAINRANNDEAEFWDLRLHPETSAYVPKLLAVVHIIKHAVDYGLVLPNWESQPYFELITSERQLDLRRLSEELQLDTSFSRLNTQYLQQITSPSQPATLLVPAAMAADVGTALATRPNLAAVSWHRYQVRSGDNLSLIADRHGVRLRALMEANGMTGTLIRPGDNLVIPINGTGPEQIAAREQTAAVTVRRGDSAWAIAASYGLRVEELLALNNLNANATIQPGQILKIPLRDTKELRVVHEVRSGDSLILIAQRYGVQVNDIRAWNSLGSSNLIYPGDELTIWFGSPDDPG